jgi:chromosome segregation ATPase
MPDHYHDSVRISDETHVTNLLNTDIEDVLENRTQRLTDQIEEVRQELERRENIHEENERDLQHQIERQEELIEKVGADVESDGELRDRIQGLYEDLRQERTEAFQDMKQLNRELRELQKQRDKLDTA